MCIMSLCCAPLSLSLLPPPFPSRRRWCSGMCYVVRSCNILAHLRCTRHRLPGTRVATLELQEPSAAVGPLKQLERVVGVGVEGGGCAKVGCKSFPSRVCCVFCEVARSLLESAQWKHLSFLSSSVFSLFCSSSSSRRVEYRRGTPARLPTGGGLNFLVQEQWFKSCLQNKKRFKF